MTNRLVIHRNRVISNTVRRGFTVNLDGAVQAAGEKGLSVGAEADASGRRRVPWEDGQLVPLFAEIHAHVTACYSQIATRLVKLKVVDLVGYISALQLWCLFNDDKKINKSNF